MKLSILTFHQHAHAQVNKTVGTVADCLWFKYRRYHEILQNPAFHQYSESALFVKNNNNIGKGLKYSAVLL